MRLPINGTELYFDVEGAGLVPDGPEMRERPVILALHGGPGFDHAYFKPWLSPLADFAQVVYLDLRCQGRSGRPAIETCTLEQMADDVASLCRTLEIHRPIILGHSAGGFVALTLAVRHPEVVGRLILLDTAAATADLDGTLDLLDQRRGVEARQAAARLFAGDTSPSAMEDFGRLVLPAYVGDPATFGPIAESLARSSFNPEVSTFWSRQCALRYNLRPRLTEIHAPTLVVVGELDWVTPPSASRAIAAKLPEAEIEILPGAGHFLFAEALDEFLRIVRRFVAAPVAVGIGGI
jgi:proline iminopeptidase